LRSALNEKTDTYLVICPLEYKEVLDAIADNASIPEIPPEKVDVYIPKDVAYINSLVSSLPVRDITVEEADNIYLLLKTYQAFRVAALREDSHYRQQTQSAIEPGLNALLFWYKAVEKELKKGRKGNFIYTLPSDLGMNLYQLRKPIQRCLEMLPKEPPEIAARNKEDIPIKDIFLDTRCFDEKLVFGEYFGYQTSRYGFFERNGINLKEWKPVLQLDGDMRHSILNSYTEGPVLGKLRYAESCLGIKYIVIGNEIAVREKDRPKMLEILSLSNEKIMQAAQFAMQIDLKKTKEKLFKNPHDKDLIYKHKWLIIAKHVPLEYMVQGIEMIYKARREKEEYINDGNWMETTR